MSSPRPVKIDMEKMVAKCGVLCFVFLGPRSPTFLDPLLNFTNLKDFLSQKAQLFSVKSMLETISTRQKQRFV